MRLGKRLKQIEAMVGPGYDHIWDCCCDHGHLGGALLSRQAAACIHFVDILPPLIEKLSENLERFFPGGPWKTYCQDVTTIPVSAQDGRQLVIIAGVGGDLMAELVRGLARANPEADTEYLLCPANRPYKLRQTLTELGLQLHDEALVEDKKYIYEIIHVSATQTGTPVSEAGDQIWQNSDSSLARRYLSRTLEHYQRQTQNSGTDSRHILDAYRKIATLYPALT